MAPLLFLPLELANKAAMLTLLMTWCRLTTFSYEGSRLKFALSNEPNVDRNRMKQTKQHATLDIMIRCGVTCSTYWSVCPWLCPDDRWTFTSEMSPRICRRSTKAVPQLRWLVTTLPTHAAQIQYQVRSCGLCCGTEVGFFRFLGFPCQFSSQRMLHRYMSSEVGSKGSLVVTVQNEFSFTPPHELQHKQEVLGRTNRIFSSDTTCTAYKTMPTVLHWSGNVFIELLPSNDRGIHRSTDSLLIRLGPHRISRLTILLLLRVFVAAETCVLSRCVDTKEGLHFIEPLLSKGMRHTHTDTQTDGRHLWSTPLRWAQVPYHTKFQHFGSGIRKLMKGGSQSHTMMVS
jgi:hypothetical protein